MGFATAQVEARARDMIETGAMPPGKALPSERALAAQLSAGRTTVRLVLAKLASEALIRAEHRRGYIVLDTDAAASRSRVPEDLEPWTIHGSRTIYDDRWVRLESVDVEPPRRRAL